MSNRDIYRSQVALLLRIVPFVSQISEFAIHGGTAINLFHSNMPRYSVDIDITYTPIEDRDTSLQNINRLLAELKSTLERHIPNIKIIHKPNVWKLLCTLNMAMVKIEVNGTKRGIVGNTIMQPLCESAQNDFHTTCTARTVSITQLYGGKLAAALSRQHPRDLFDFTRMPYSFNEIRDGLMFALLSSDKPVIESLNPNPIDQHSALEQQFIGMTEQPFTYTDYEKARLDLHNFVKEGLSTDDKRLLLSFESGEPDWSLTTMGDLSKYPSIQWKLLNIKNLQNTNASKFAKGIDGLSKVLNI